MTVPGRMPSFEVPPNQSTPNGALTRVLRDPRVGPHPRARESSPRTGKRPSQTDQSRIIVFQPLATGRGTSKDVSAIFRDWKDKLPP